MWKEGLKNSTFTEHIEGKGQSEAANLIPDEIGLQNRE